MKRHVIVGNGIAALSAALAIREHSTDPVLVISRESCPAYAPMLTPYYIRGRIPYRAMFIGSSALYERMRIEINLGKTVVRVDPPAKKVYLDNGDSVQYDNLLIATGAWPVAPHIGAFDAGHVYTLRTENDAKRIRKALRRAKTVAIIGAGLIGIHLIDALHGMQKRITVLETAEHVLPGVLDLEGAMMLQARMEQEGIELHLQSRVSDIDNSEGPKWLYLENGTVLQADMVIIAIGVKPHTDLTRNSGIKVDRGILVDEYCLTNVRGIYAAGDAAQVVDPISRKHRANPTWIDAVFQGRTAGLNMVGLNMRLPRRVRANILSILGLAVASIGLIASDGHGYTITRKRRQNEYKYLCVNANRLVGTILIGDVSEAGLMKSRVEQGTIHPVNCWTTLDARRLPY